MKHMKTFAVYVILIVSLSFASCDWVDWENIGFAYELQGTWVSNDPSIYSGTLKIAKNKITITGYTASQTPIHGGNDSQRPFKDFIKGYALKGYSDEESRVNGVITGHIFIEEAGKVRAGIPYTYWSDSPSSSYRRTHFLHLTFGGRQEVLQRTD